MECGLRLRYSASANVGKDLRQENAGQGPDKRRNEQEPGSRRCQSEQQMSDTLDGERKQDGGQPRQDAHDNRQREKQLVLAKSKSLTGKGSAVGHGSPAPCARAISTSA